MIVCSCNFITREEIVDVITGFLGVDEWQLITPGMVYHAMAQRGKCCGCFPGVIDIIIQTTSAFHRNNATPEAEIIVLTDRIREAHRQHQEIRMLAQTKKPAKKPARAA